MTHLMKDLDDDAPTQASIGGLLACLGAVYVLAIAWTTVGGDYSYDVWGGIAVATVLALVSWTIIVSLNRRDTDPLITRILILAFFAKQVGTLARYWFVTTQGGDALEYHAAGRALAPLLRAQDFGAAEFARWVPEFTGTTNLRIITGVIYNLFGTSLLGGFMAFSMLSFWGTYLMYRGYRMVFPDGPHRRYALLLLFAPTMLFWPSSTGKDAWMIFMIGLAIYGAVRVYLLAPGGYLVLGLAIAGSAIIRVHVTAMMLAAFIAGTLFSRTRRHHRGRGRGFLRSALTIAFIAGCVVFTAARASTFFESVGGGTITGTLDETVRRSSTGGSSYRPARVTSPTELPVAIVTVLYRPFPSEAHNVAARLTSLEGAVLLLLTLASLRRLARLPVYARTHALVGLAIVYCGLFIVAFSTISNFGILARQRSQLYPMFFLLLTLPRMDKRSRRRGGDSDDVEPVDLDAPRSSRQRFELTGAGQ